MSYEDYKVLLMHSDDDACESEVIFSTRDDDGETEDNVYFYINGGENLKGMLGKPGWEFTVLKYKRLPTEEDYEAGVDNEFYEKEWDEEWLKDWNDLMTVVFKLSDEKNLFWQRFIDWLCEEYADGNAFVDINDLRRAIARYNYDNAYPNNKT